MKLCRHCNRVPSNRPRGLCWSCYYKPGVRDQYPPTSKYASKAGNGWRHDTETMADVERIIAEQLPTMPPSDERRKGPKRARRWTVPVVNLRQRGRRINRRKRS